MPSNSALLQTPRLRLRRIEATDVDALLAVCGDAEGMRWLGDGKPLAPADCARWVVVTQQNYATRGHGLFAVLLLASGAVIGFCGLVHPRGQAACELKYAFGRAHWGQGYATAAAAALLAHAASAFGVCAAIATAAPENLASHRVLLKAGMRRGEVRTDEDGSRTQVFCWQAGAAGAKPG